MIGPFIDRREESNARRDNARAITFSNLIQETGCFLIYSGLNYWSNPNE